MSSSYLYVDTPNANLVCCICRSPFVDPCTTRTCCHTFCYKCISMAVDVARQCPIDRSPLSMHDLAPADPVVRNLVDELVVECPQHSKGCPHTCQRLLLTAHLKDSCGFVEVPCPDGKCEQQILRNDVPNHKHAGESSTGAESHPESSLTTPEIETRSTSPRPVSAPTADVLAAENALLRMRLSALEGIVSAMRLEMHAVQRALGPWYRPHDTRTRTPPLELELDARSASEVSHRPVAFEAVPPQQTQVPRPNPSGNAAQPSDSAHGPAAHPVSNVSAVPATAAAESAGINIASYFPPAEDDSTDVYATAEARAPWHTPYHTQAPAAITPARRSSPHPPQASNAQAGPSSAFLSPMPGYLLPYPPFSSSAYPSPSYALPPPTLSPPDINVPPLDPATPLPETLAALHSTLSTLAGSVGALASARASEALHTGEELRGMRAAMHGLRMQLHDVLTALSMRDGSSINSGGVGNEASGAGVPYGVPAGMPPWMAYPPRALGAYMSMHPKPPMPPSTTKL
ncbi:hypothetical protein SCP_0311840 [Sparassis crispa]|uniref:RING-type domain-containing protein n=1 Tax=Sparassis crispa TaxID=139825 RepID=A0A401GH53_9APHY|nr:hypothetical protein SCP_0311840 [Sparassis crispa]GBE81455.1 hypothetical protein SCP_0311840 [Sparassis crispa]